VFTTSGTYPWSFVIQIFHNGQPSQVATVELFEEFIPVFSGVRVTRSFVLCVCFVDNCLFYLAIVLSVLRRILITFLVYEVMTST
jgi:hypothetical protein